MYRILLVAIAVMAIGGIAVNCYVGNYYRADSIAEAAIDSDREVAVTIEKKDKRIQATQYDLRHKNYTITFAGPHFKRGLHLMDGVVVVLRQSFLLSSIYWIL